MSKRQKCPECKGKTQCDCHLCWGRGYLKPKAEGSRLQPQQPDDQYPGVPVQGWTPMEPDNVNLLYVQDQIARRLKSLEPLFVGKMRMACIVYDPDDYDTAMATLSKDAKADEVIAVLNHLERITP